MKLVVAQDEKKNAGNHQSQQGSSPGYYECLCNILWQSLLVVNENFVESAPSVIAKPRATTTISYCCSACAVTVWKSVSFTATKQLEIRVWNKLKTPEAKNMTEQARGPWLKQVFTLDKFVCGSTGSKVQRLPGGSRELQGHGSEPELPRPECAHVLLRENQRAKPPPAAAG